MTQPPVDKMVINLGVFTVCYTLSGLAVALPLSNYTTYLISTLGFYGMLLAAIAAILWPLWFSVQSDVRAALSR